MSSTHCETRFSALCSSNAEHGPLTQKKAEADRPWLGFNSTPLRAVSPLKLKLPAGASTCHAYHRTRAASSEQTNTAFCHTTLSSGSTRKHLHSKFPFKHLTFAHSQNPDALDAEGAPAPTHVYDATATMYPHLTSNHMTSFNMFHFRLLGFVVHHKAIATLIDLDYRDTDLSAPLKVQSAFRLLTISQP